MAVPEDWMGKRVAFSIEGGNRNIEGELVEVNDRGIVIAFTGREATPRTLFYPWRIVRAIEIGAGQATEGESPAV
jgi:hypothetical protein